MFSLGGTDSLLEEQRSREGGPTTILTRYVVTMMMIKMIKMMIMSSGPPVGSFSIFMVHTL